MFTLKIGLGVERLFLISLTLKGTYSRVQKKGKRNRLEFLKASTKKGIHFLTLYSVADSN